MDKHERPRVAVFPGSFDPPTLGHADIIERAAPLFDSVVVAVLNNTAKTPLFSTEERCAMLYEAAASCPNVAVVTYGGLLTEWMVRNSVQYIVRSVRSPGDWSHESALAQANHQLGGAETVLLFAKPEYACLSSGLVREVAQLGYAAGFDDTILDRWVHPSVKERLQSKYTTQRGVRK